MTIEIEKLIRKSNSKRNKKKDNLINLLIKNSRLAIK